MSDIITLVSKEYATGNFQSKLTEANEGDNIKITGEGDNLKISAEVPAQAKTTITTSDARVAVTETQTGYDLALNGSFIERGEYTELENTVGGHTTSITNLEQSVAGKQDTLTAGTGINLNNNTISVDTATTVGDSNLPVTASAVNTKLGDYATTTQLNNKQDDVGLYIDDDGYVSTGTGIKQGGGAVYENFFDSPTTFGNYVEFQSDAVIQNKKPVLDVTSSDDSVTVTRSSDGYGVDLKANGGGSGELKSDKWFCVAFYTAADLPGFEAFDEADDVIKEVWTWTGAVSLLTPQESNCAVITFQKPMSMVEINSYFATKKLVMGGMGNIVESTLFPMMAVCPYDGNLPSEAHRVFTP